MCEFNNLIKVYRLIRRYKFNNLITYKDDKALGNGNRS